MSSPQSCGKTTHIKSWKPVGNQVIITHVFLIKFSSFKIGYLFKKSHSVQNDDKDIEIRKEFTLILHWKTRVPIVVLSS